MKRTSSANLELCAEVLSELLAELDRANTVTQLALKHVLNSRPRLANLHTALLGALQGAVLYRMVCLKRECSAVSFHPKLEEFCCPLCGHLEGAATS